MVHELLEKCAKGEIAPDLLPIEYCKEYPKRVLHDFPPNDFINLNASYHHDGLNFLQRFDGFDRIKVLGVEKGFKETIDNDFYLQGFIDLLYENKNGKLVVHDWKSKSRFKDKATEKEFRKQLYVYSLYVKNRYGKYPNILQFYLFRKFKTVACKFNKSDFIKTIDWCKKSVDNIRNYRNWNSYTYDDFFCNNLCDYRLCCPYAKKERKNR